jgi:hypothetical protein
MAISTTLSNTHLFSTSTNFTASTVPFSISVWINAVWNGGARLSFVGLYNGTATAGTTTGLQIGTSAGGGQVTCWTYGGTTMVTSAAGVMTPYNNTWANVTYTYNGTTHLLYVNGVQVGTGATAQNAGTFTQIWINGYPPTGTTNECAVFGVDSYTYYNRTLSADEALTIYNAAGARHGILNGQLARYEFDELAQGATVTSVTDLSGNSNTLSISGTGTAFTYNYATSYANSNLRAPI